MMMNGDYYSLGDNAKVGMPTIDSTMNIGEEHESRRDGPDSLTTAGRNQTELQTTLSSALSEIRMKNGENSNDDDSSSENRKLNKEKIGNENKRDWPIEGDKCSTLSNVCQNDKILYNLFRYNFQSTCTIH